MFARLIDLSIALVIVSAFVLLFGMAEEAVRRLTGERNNRRMRRQIAWYHVAPTADVRVFVRPVDQPLKKVA